MSRLNYRLMWTAVAILAAISLWFGASYALVPTAYYQVHMYTIQPPVACPDDPIKSWGDRTIHGFHFLERGNYALDGEWFNPKTLQTESLTEKGGTFIDNEVGRDTKLSPWVRTAPSSPGNWRLRLTMTLNGKVLGIKRQWIVPYESSDLLEVLPLSAKECRVS